MANETTKRRLQTKLMKRKKPKTNLRISKQNIQPAWTICDKLANNGWCPFHRLQLQPCQSLIRGHVLPKIQSRRCSDKVVLASCKWVCGTAPLFRLVPPISIATMCTAKSDNKDQTLSDTSELLHTSTLHLSFLLTVSVPLILVKSCCK